MTLRFRTRTVPRTTTPATIVQTEWSARKWNCLAVIVASMDSMSLVKILYCTTGKNGFEKVFDLGKDFKCFMNWFDPLACN